MFSWCHVFTSSDVRRFQLLLSSLDPRARVSSDMWVQSSSFQFSSRRSALVTLFFRMQRWFLHSLANWIINRSNDRNPEPPGGAHATVFSRSCCVQRFLRLTRWEPELKVTEATSSHRRPPGRHFSHLMVTTVTPHPLTHLRRPLPHAVTSRPTGPNSHRRQRCSGPLPRMAASSGRKLGSHRRHLSGSGLRHPPPGGRGSTDPSKRRGTMKTCRSKN